MLNGDKRRLVLRRALKFRKATEAITSLIQQFSLPAASLHIVTLSSFQRHGSVTLSNYLVCFMRLLQILPALIIAAGTLAAQPVTSVTLNGQHFVNHGLVGVGRIPANLKDKFGETFGSFSAFTFQPGSWQRNANGSYSGTLFSQPDSG